MMIKYFVFSAIISYIGSSAQSRSDSAKLLSYEDKVAVKISFNTNTENFVAFYKDSPKDVQTIFSINESLRTSFSIDYKLISATMSFTPSFLPGNSDNDLKGKSKYTDFKFRLFPGRFIQTIEYKNAKGFYIKNMQDFFPDWEKGKEPYFQLPDLKYQTFGARTSYVFNKDFSLKSILYQREWQNNSSGSFIPELQYNISLFKNKNGEVKSRETQFNLGIDLGYHYNWVIKTRMNIGLYIFTGMGIRWTTYRYDLQNSDTQNNRYLIARAGTGLYFGYNSETSFFGIKFNLSSNYYREDSSSEITNNNTFSVLYFGYRFPPPRFLKKYYNNVKKRLPFL